MQSYLNEQESAELLRLLEADRAAELAEARCARLAALGVPHWPSEFIPHDPTEKQLAFLKLTNIEAYYGGAAGGGKSDALLMAGLQYVDVPNYAALLLRRTLTDLSLPGALMDRAHEWLEGTPARWSEREKKWHFPSGSTLTFGYLEHENDKYRYQSSEFQYVGCDEVTQFTETQYTYLYSRLRRLAGSDVPLRMRAASNPDGEGFEWCKKRFIPDEYVKSRDESKFERVWRKGNVIFIPSRLEDNPHLDRQEYDRSLEHLDMVTHARLRHGDWDALPAGELIKPEWFGIDKYFPALPEGAHWQYRAWDLAVKARQVMGDQKKGRQPDFHASVKGCVWNGDLWLAAPLIWRSEWAEAVDRIMALMMVETDVTHGTGKGLHETAAVQALVRQGFNLLQYAESQDLVSRAGPFINQARLGKVKLVGTPQEWQEFTYWWWKFPLGAHDDSVACTAGLTEMLGLVFEPVERKQSAQYNKRLVDALRSRAFNMR